MNEDELTAIEETVLDAAELIDLGRQIESHASVVEARVKGTATARAAEATSDLWPALNAVLSGSAHAAQLSYVFQGTLWIDTVLRSADGFRVVRFEQRS